MYGIYREALYNKYLLYYYQNLFVRGAKIKENFVFIKICDKDSLNVREEKNNFLYHMLNVVDSKSFPDYDKTEGYDDERFHFHGVDAKVLIFCEKIVAIGNCNENYWITVENFFEGIEGKNIKSFKESLVKNKINECEKEIENYLIFGSTTNEKYLKNIKLLNILTK